MKRSCWLEIWTLRRPTTKIDPNIGLGTISAYGTNALPPVVAMETQHRGFIEIGRIAKTGSTRVDQVTRLRRSGALSPTLFESQTDRRQESVKQGCYEVVNF